MLIPTLGIFSVIATIFFIAERVDPARPQRIFRRGFFTDCVYVFSSVAIRILVNGTLAVALSRIGARYLPDHAIGVLRDRPVWVQFLAILFALDLIFYFMHRAKHTYRWLWRLHETHHSSADLDWFSSVRFHPLEKLLDRTMYLAPLLFLGVSEEALLLLAGMDAVIASFGHSNLNWRIGPLIYVIVGPEMHRWHHSRNPRFQNVNFGNNLSIFDWIFGTAYLTREDPTAFGVNDPEYPEGNYFRQLLYAFRRQKQNVLRAPPAAPAEKPLPEPVSTP